jgi:hypothetical protein
MLRLDRDNRRDTPQYTYEAFECGTYSKISELINFETRLAKSLQLATVYADYATLSILEVCHHSHQILFSARGSLRQTLPKP